MSTIQSVTVLVLPYDVIFLFSRPDLTVGEMMNFVYYISTFNKEDIDADKVFSLSIDHIIRETDEALLICVERVTYGSFIKKEINIWFPKSAIADGVDLHINNRTSVIYVKGWFLIKLIEGQYKYEA
jgi:hypothetical protein